MFSKRARSIFFETFLISFVVIFFIATRDGYVDVSFWAQAATLISQGSVIPQSAMTFGYPGATILFPAAAFIKAAMPALPAISLVILIEIALLVAAITVLTYLLRPHSIWWIATGALLITNPIYYFGTPPSVILALLITCMILCLFYFARRDGGTTTSQYAALGMLGGLACATRFDFSALFLACLACFIAGKSSLRNGAIFCLTALIVCFACTPFLWLHPFTYLLDVYGKITEHLASPDSFSMSTKPLIPAEIFAGLSFCCGLWCILAKSAPFARAEFVWSWCVTLLLGVVLLALSFHPIWYFFPLILVWEILLPAFALPLLQKIPVRENLFSSQERFALDCMIALAVIQLTFLLI